MVYANNRCSEMHTEHRNALLRQRIALLNIKPNVTVSNHCAFKG